MITSAIQLSMRNKKALTTCVKAGCYHCSEIFETKDITEYTDQGETALCPKCNVDAVIPNSKITKEELKEIHNYWFN